MSTPTPATPPLPPRQHSAQLPQLPTVVLDPRPVLLLGTIAWLLALLVLLMLDAPPRQIALCGAGVAVGLLGGMVYVLQRRAVQRGVTGAQQGLDFDNE